MAALSDLDGTVPGMDDLTDLEGEVLAFAGLQWRHTGARDSAIREQLGLTPTRFHQLLNDLVDRPAALAADPMLVKRLRRLREQRMRGRGRLGPGAL